MLSETVDKQANNQAYKEIFNKSKAYQLQTHIRKIM